MILSDFSFTRDYWSLNNIHLQGLTLLVGPNAVGKSKTLDSILRVSDYITGRKLIQEKSSFSTQIRLEDSLDSIEYSFSVKLGLISSEALSVNGEIKVQRNSQSAFFFGEEVNPPLSRLLLGSRRDTEKYPQIERIMSFFESVSLFSFSQIIPGKKVVDPITIGGIDVAGLFAKLSDKSRETIVTKLNDLGFKVGKLYPFETVSNTLIAMKEEGVDSEFVMWAFSTGLIRVVSLLTYLFYLSETNKEGIILIDDLGEGLDYHRSTKLGSFVCDFCRENGIQLVLTTNDSFLMNVIDINNWNVLSREGSTVSAISTATDPELFADFKLTGLSNYDFFRSDFIAKNRQ